MTRRPPEPERGKLEGALQAAMTGPQGATGDAASAASRAHSEALYRLLVEHGPDLIAVHELDGRFRYVSPSVRGVLGLDPPQVPGFDPAALFRPEDVERVRQEIRACLAAKAAHTAFRHRFTLDDGRSVWLETHVVPLYEDPADPERATAVMTSSRDITATRRAEEALATSEARLRLALQATGLGILDVERPSRAGHYSDEYLRIFGYGPEHREQFAAGWEPLVHPEDAPEFARRRNAPWDDNAHVDISVRRMHRDGRWVWVRAVGRVYDSDDQGRPRRWLGTVQDIDRQRRDEHALRENQARLNEAQAIARLGDWHVDGETGRHHWSDQAFRVLGLEPGACESSLRSFLERVHPEDLDRLKKLARDVGAAPAEASGDVRVVLPDGSIRHLHLRIHVGEGQGGPGRGLKGTAQDVTEDRQIRAELREARDQLRRLSSHREDVLNEERKRIALDVHDEVGQMLTAVRLQVDMLEAKAGDEQATKMAAQRMRSLIEDAIEVARNIALSLRPPALDLGLRPALEWLAEDFTLRAEVLCTVEAGADEIVVGEKASIELFRIAQESLTNVARHAGARAVRIFVSRDADSLRLGIEDDGCGFDVTASHAGSHFGLLSMRERALRLGGRLHIASEPGRGTTVVVEMPVPAGRSEGSPS